MLNKTFHSNQSKLSDLAVNPLIQHKKPIFRKTFNESIPKVDNND